VSSEGVGPPLPEGFGRYLAQQRELRGLSLQSVADATKLSAGQLKALETEDYSRLPERVFVVGMVKAYARCVGLSVEETVLRLQESMGPILDEPTIRRRRSQRGLMIGLVAGGIALAGALAALVHHWK
jgi:cytoskeletal protein RodZ